MATNAIANDSKLPDIRMTAAQVSAAKAAERKERMTTNAKHVTQGQWRVGDAGHGIFGPNLGKPAPEMIADVQKPDNARHIVLCVNSHDALLAALEALVEHVTHDGACGNAETPVFNARAAIAKARGKS